MTTPTEQLQEQLKVNASDQPINPVVSFELPQNLWETLMENAEFSTFISEGVVYGFIEFKDMGLKYGLSLGWHGEEMKEWFEDQDGVYIKDDPDKSFKKYALNHIHYWRNC